MNEAVSDPQAYKQAYKTEDFAAPELECDLVMKGGVTSGLVYPQAILELAKKYRFRSIGGTSAGAIASAFAAAAEYARTVRQDPSGFVRMAAHCDQLPQILPTLFQPIPPLAPLMRFLLKAQAGKGVLHILAALVGTLWFRTVIGALVAGAVMAFFGGGIAGTLLAAVIGGVVAIALYFYKALTRTIPDNNFGLCTGLTQPGQMTPALTDWLHSSLQDIAFGDPAYPTPFTFGHLTEGAKAGPAIDLRMVTTNLSMRRPHQLPRLDIRAGFLTTAWQKFFPATVMNWLESRCHPMRRGGGVLQFPSPQNLPVVVATRMSLSFPVLFSAVPLFTRDIQSAILSNKTGGKGKVQVKKLLFSDGGLSSNFPIHMFDALLPTRPTFALSLDDLPTTAKTDGERVFIPVSAREGSHLPVDDITGLGGFAFSLLNSAKDWQDQLLSVMPGQRERIARVYLSPKEGGLNLTMPADVSRALMGYGRTVGERFAKGALNFDEHRWRRALTVYAHLEATTLAVEDVWTNKGFGTFAAAYFPKAISYGRVGKGDRQNIRLRLAAFGKLSTAFTPEIKNKADKFPNPAGRLGIRPDV